MGTTILSNVNNKYVIAKETSYGVIPAPFTKLDFGQVQTIEFTEDEGLEEVSSINTGHTIGHLEPGVYKGAITITTRPSKSALPVLLEAIAGSRVDATDYTITTTLTTNNTYYMQVTDDLTKVWDLAGVCFTSMTFNFNKGQLVSMDLTGVFKKATSASGTITPLTNNAGLFSWLDCYISFGGAQLKVNSFTLGADWNVSEDDSRSIQQMSAGERRLIAQVVKNRIKVSGSCECYVSTDINTGYVDEITTGNIVVTMNRGSDNEHVITITSAGLTNKKNTASIDNSAKTMSFDYTGVDFGVTGDL
jgi:hypothetical protein